ncbi:MULTISPECIES: HpcH/HpaI aldolase family protein [Paraburkholderia]|uniref:2-dehydro-3-deoxyglucarate aldolase n=1 Tax=Paraburkholderia tropica TaxID=92647 RepID=A0A1A5X725_9BURK|nr:MULTISPECIES: aldolase/citrate lyase family protein [Paraburkholderia]MBB2978048.1 2-dehydro-3-deoxyglucarate aldolase [Paraburkholderia tropica]MBB2998245.1 2-dehydro-3-deoxyglucarate aldolase [Paraburkholderia tropica]MBB6317268.1 2-dehydro-3-deoxyglucarate aldolase [Paraburkholderia tropica]MDE1142168.1 aldolase/citrate lyase family protein [Paraburkholderia tropica]OBR49341.1 2-dehydro-3-deoxyglucarate aldolase [Paraburkholderia tropica]
MSTFTNPLKERLKDAEPLFGLWLSMGSETAAEALAHAGFDWLLIDMEHTPNDSGDTIAQLRAIAAAHLPTEPVVRVAANEPWLVKHVLDAGARTVMFPNIASAAEAARAVSTTRYPDAQSPDGQRGVAGVVRAAAYGMRRDYLHGANAQIATLVQIESAAALAEVEQIAAVPGVDCLFVGPADLAASLGHLGDSKHPDVQAAMTRIVAAARAAGVAAGIFAMDAAQAKQYREMGFSFIALAADVIWLVRATRQALQEARS